MWEYHTSVRPRRPRKDGDTGNVEHRKELELAYNKFLEGLVGDLAKLREATVASGGKMRKLVPTKDEEDVIDANSDYHVKFTKSKFLVGQRLRRDMVRMLGTVGLGLVGPQQGENGVWVIDYSVSRNKGRSNRPRQREKVRSGPSE